MSRYKSRYKNWLLAVDILVPRYQDVIPFGEEAEVGRSVERVQTGIRLEKRLLKVLKGLAEHLDMSVGDLIEGMALHAFDNKLPFGEETLGKIAKLKEVYDLDLYAADSHRLEETS